MKCLKCNAPIAEGAFFCEECKTKFQNYKVCSNCQNKIPKDVLFCSQCGSTSFSQGVEAYKEEVAFEKNTEAETELSQEAAASKEGPMLKQEPKSTSAEELEKTMAIPVIKPGIRYGDAPSKVNAPAYRYNGDVASPRPVPKDAYPKKAPARPYRVAAKPMPGGDDYSDSGDTAKKIIVFIAVFLSVVLVGFSSIFLYMNYFK